jgi:membrane protein YqaA with SNARE-associated domain
VYSLLFSWLPVVGDPLCLAGGMLKVNFWLFSLLVATGKCARYVITAVITVSAAG